MYPEYFNYVTLPYDSTMIHCDHNIILKLIYCNEIKNQQCTDYFSCIKTQNFSAIYCFLLLNQEAFDPP